MSIGIGLVAKLVAGYTGYRRDRAKEDDLAVRRRIVDEIAKSKLHLANLTELQYEAGNRDRVSLVRKVTDELDLFSRDLELSEVGHKYPSLSIQKSIRKKDIDRLVEHDKKLVGTMSMIVKESRRAESKFILDNSHDISTTMSTMRQKVTSVRDLYRDRQDCIGRMTR